MLKIVRPSRVGPRDVVTVTSEAYIPPVRKLVGDITFI